MALYFRKRLGMGPLALNFSRSGVGLSLGVRGFRMGWSSRMAGNISALACQGRELCTATIIASSCIPTVPKPLTRK